MEQRDYFEYLSERGRISRMLRYLFLRPLVQYFRGRVLDIGSGIGEFLSYYPDAVGIDANAACVALCKRKGLSCVQADAYDIPFGPDSFDGVLLNNVLEHLNDADALFKEIVRLLKDGGRLVIELPGRKGFEHDSTHLQHWEKHDIVPFLRARGFFDISTSYFPIPFSLAGDLFTHNKLRVFARLNKKPGGVV